MNNKIRSSNEYEIEFLREKTKLWCAEYDTQYINIINIYRAHEKIKTLKMSTDTTDELYNELINVFIFERNFTYDLPQYSSDSRTSIRVDLDRDDRVTIMIHERFINGFRHTIFVYFSYVDFVDYFCANFFYEFLKDY